MQLHWFLLVLSVVILGTSATRVSFQNLKHDTQGWFAGKRADITVCLKGTRRNYRLDESDRWRLVLFRPWHRSVDLNALWSPSIGSSACWRADFQLPRELVSSRGYRLQVRRRIPNFPIPRLYWWSAAFEIDEYKVSDASLRPGASWTASTRREMAVVASKARVKAARLEAARITAFKLDRHISTIGEKWTAQLLTKFLTADEVIPVDDSPMALPNSVAHELEVVTGFDFCRDLLEGSVFRSHVPFHALLSRDNEVHVQSVATTLIEFGELEFAHFIDSIARRVLIDMGDKGDKALACFLAADGRNKYLRFSHMKLLQYVDPQSAFPHISWKEVGGPNDSSLKHYDLAIVLLVKPGTGVRNAIRHLVTTAESLNIIIFMQGDLGQDEVTSSGWSKAVIHARNSQDGSGTAAQLAAMFELADMATFDYVTTVSSFDLAMVDIRQFYSNLKIKHNGRSVFQTPARVPSVSLPKFLNSRNAKAKIKFDGWQGYSFRPVDGSGCALTYSFVNAMRADSATATLMLPFEWSKSLAFLGAYAQWHPSLPVDYVDAIASLTLRAQGRISGMVQRRAKGILKRVN